jgi:hypothetical protein
MAADRRSAEALDRGRLTGHGDVPPVGLGLMNGERHVVRLGATCERPVTGPSTFAGLPPRSVLPGRHAWLRGRHLCPHPLDHGI